MLPAGGGEPERLTDLKEDVGEPAWSPDGTRIAFSARVPDEAYEEEDEKKRAPRRFTRLQFKLDSVGWTGDRRRHLYVVPADGSAEPKQITDGDYEDSRPTWTPDGKSIAFSSARGEDWDIELISDIYVVPADGGEPKRLTPGDSNHYAPQLLAGRDAARGQVGSGRIRLSAPPADRRRRRRDGREPADPDRVARPDVRSRTRRSGEPIWDGDSIVFAIEDAGNIHLYRVAAVGRRARAPHRRRDRPLAATTRATGSSSAPARPRRTCPSSTSGDRQLTDIGSEFAGGRELVAPERFTAVSKDGTEVEAWIARPAGFEEGKRYPVLLNIHGGPVHPVRQRASSTRPRSTPAAATRSSTRTPAARPATRRSGAARSWGRASSGPGWGTVDYEDLMAVVDTALERYDFLDPERLGVLGGSYGGYMTSWIVSHTNRFKAACSERAVNNLVSMYGSSDIGWVFKGYHGEFVHDEVEKYLADVAVDVREADRDAAPDPPLRAGPPLQHRAGRAALHDAAAAEEATSSWCASPARATS